MYETLRRAGGTNAHAIPSDFMLAHHLALEQPFYGLQAKKLGIIDIGVPKRLSNETA
ncbi:MAG: hypothetical protein ABFS56_14165 [Pseudomonadota bacterium]